MIVWISLFVYQSGLLESALSWKQLQLNSEPFLAGGEHFDNRNTTSAAGYESILITGVVPPAAVVVNRSSSLVTNSADRGRTNTRGRHMTWH